MSPTNSPSPDGASQIVIVDAFTDWGDDFAVERTHWKPLGATLTLARCQSESDIVAAAASADVVAYLGLYTPFTAGVMAALPRCRMIIRFGIGMDSVDIPAATDLGIVVANAALYCVPEVADHAAALLLSLARRVVFLDRFVHAGKWSDSAEAVGGVHRLSGLTLGLVGLGRIGRQVARRMAPFFGTILGSDPYVGQSVADELGVTMVELPDLLAQSDLVSVHTPLLPETRGLIGRAELNHMKPTAFLVNTSRGPVVDEAELIRALHSGAIAGAALDVVESEPLAPDSPLRAMANVVLTPHFSATSVESMQDLRLCVAESVANVIQGHLPPHVMNPTVKPRFPLQGGRD